MGDFALRYRARWSHDSDQHIAAGVGRLAGSAGRGSGYSDRSYVHVARCLAMAHRAQTMAAALPGNHGNAFRAANRSPTAMGGHALGCPRSGARLTDGGTAGRLAGM